MNKLKVAMFSTHDIRGGAAVASKRLSDGLLQSEKVRLKYFVKYKHAESDSTINLTSQNQSQEIIDFLINEKYIKENRSNYSDTLFSFSFIDAKLSNLLNNYDIINLHWIEKYLSFSNLYELTQLRIPIIWTLHDMKAFTGGCHYNAGCENFVSDCSKCLQLSNDPMQISTLSLEVKKEIFQNSNLTIVTPSKWLADEAKRSSLFRNKPIQVIPYGIDMNQFYPVNKHEAKTRLGIAPNAIVLTFGAVDQGEKRKGYRELLNALTELKKRISDGKQVVALFFGKEKKGFFPIPIINTGYINNNKQLSLIYSAADIFILPSLEDNFPNTMLESLSCETPVIAFDTGGARDIINDSNGKVVPQGNVQALCGEIFQLINNPSLRKEKGKNGRKTIEKQYQLHHQANSYIQLFEELSEKNFPYSAKTIDIQNSFNELIGYTYNQYSSTNIQKHLFSRQYNRFYEQIEILKNNNLRYVIYGYGKIGKTIEAILTNQVVAFIDKNSKILNSKIIKADIYAPENIHHISFDKIIISVLGREKVIKAFLIGVLKIEPNKICEFRI